MRNITFKKLAYILMGLYLLAPQVVFAKSTLPAEFKVVFAKFSVGMIGVALFSFLIYLALALYNKFFVAPHIKNEEMRRNSLNSPRDKDEAISDFIMRNRLK